MYYKIKGDKDRSFLVLDSGYGDLLYAKKGVFAKKIVDITQVVDGVKNENNEFLKAIRDIQDSFVTRLKKTSCKYRIVFAPKYRR